MKKIFFVIAAAAMMLVGCTKELTQRLDKVECDLEDLTTRVEKLEQAVKDLNAETTSIQTLLNGTSKLVADVTETANGYKISFTDGTSATITGAKGEKGDKGDQGDKGDKGDKGDQGEKGEQGAAGADAVIPQIGIAAGEDGVLYWTLDGKFITLEDGSYVPARGEKGDKGDQGEKGEQGEQGTPGAPGAAGADGAVVTPSFAIDENGHLIMTIGDTKTDLGDVTGEDGEQGATGETGATGATGATGDSWFSGVDTTNPAFVVITLNDEAETKITLPVYSEFDIVFASAQVPVVSGATVAVPYTVTGVAEGETATVRAHASAGVTAEVTEKTIEVTVAEGTSVKNAYVYVTLTNDTTGTVVVKCLSFSEGVLKVVEGIEIPAAGGTATIEVETDMDYVVSIPEDAEWLTDVTTKATRKDILTFAGTKNGNTTRATVVSLVVDEVVVGTFTVTQKALAETFTVTPETLQLPVFGEEKFTVAVTPADADQNVEWTLPSELVMDGNFIKVSPEAIAGGYANVIAGKTYTVTATSVSNPDLTAELSVEVTAVMAEEIDIPAPKEYIAARVGQIVPLEWTVLPENASDKTVTFASTNEKVITVDEEGIVTVVGPGEAKIVITSNDQFCTLAEDPAAYVAPSADVVFAVSKELAASSIAFPAEAVNLPVKGEADITPVVGPEDAAETSVDYQILLDGKASSDLVVVDGMVKLNPNFVDTQDLVAKVGNTYTVVASLVSNPTVTDEIEVTVTAVLVESLAAEAFTTKMGEAAYTAAPEVTFTPADADDKTLYWTIKEGADVIKINANTGVIEPIKAGYATVVATSYDAFTTDFEAARPAVEIPVTVLYEDGTPVLKGIEFANELVTINIDDQDGEDLGLVIDPNAAKAEVTYTVVNSLNSKYHDVVVKDGKATLDFSEYSSFTPDTQLYYKRSAIGKYTVTATCGEFTATTVLEVVANKVTELSLGAEKLVMYVGEEYVMQYTIGPADANDLRVNWRTTDIEGVITVDQNGKVTAKKAGTATVVLESLDVYADKAPTSTCVVEVRQKAPEAVTVEKTAYTVKLGESLQLPAPVVTPEDANMYNHEVEWSVVSAGTGDVNFTIDQNGLLTPRKDGFGMYVWNQFSGNVNVVTVASKADPTVKATITVTVDLNLATAVSVAFDDKTMYVGETFFPTLDVVPADASNADVYHFTAYNAETGAYDADAIKDNNDGSYIALKAGKYTIKVTMDSKIGAYEQEPPFTTYPLTVTEVAAQ